MAPEPYELNELHEPYETRFPLSTTDHGLWTIVPNEPNELNEPDFPTPSLVGATANG